MPSASEIRQQFIDFFCQEARPHVRAVVARRAARRSDAALHQRRHESVQGRVSRHRHAAIQAGGQHAEVHPRRRQAQRSRRRRQGHLSPHVFRDARQLELRRLLQAEAIQWAWELLTQVWKLDKTRLHATVFEGSPDEGVPRDDEASNSGRPSRTSIRRTSIGATRRTISGRWARPARAAPAPRFTTTARPIDRGGPLVNKGTPSVIEIWNLVFIQFNRNADQVADAAAGQARRYRHGLRARSSK